MDLVSLYQCLGDRTRLRILNLLTRGPLCVCHIQEVLDESQVKISKHLSHLKTRGVVEARREGYWRIYRLAAKPDPALKANLACLRDVAGGDKILRRDLARRVALDAKIEAETPACCAPAKKPRSKSKLPVST